MGNCIVSKKNNNGKNLLLIENMFESFLNPQNITEDQKIFLSVHKSTWTFIGYYLDYLESKNLGYNSFEPKLDEGFSSNDKPEFEFNKKRAILYYQMFQVIKVGWDLIEKTKDQPNSKIFSNDTPRKVLNRVLEDLIAEPIKLAFSNEINAGFSTKEWYEKLRLEYKFYSDSEKLEEKRSKKMRDDLKNGNTWDWCLHCIWEHRYKRRESSCPGQNLKSEYKNFLSAQRDFNGLVRKKTNIKDRHAPKLFTIRWTAGKMTDSNGQKILYRT